MYAFLWRHLPGPVYVKVLVALIVAAVIVVLLFGWIFPWVEPLMPFSGNTVSQ
ncbi:hypothetical protein KGQ20_00780 [Catenulispora sp. NF23]|uniref:Uncharacterized protein n=1 Tax=Catenulispora pinistramenti TaxID=2705254 RepID=A0ABS5KI80_9ACTN|nr:hypothetical protein [Catenulispora pinistramenti]MBS2531296.1 hypothetical protein [Catenulispora pinistramenti]MBS2545978.1 hypothetical protein [Catenulispora pinistramenti]